MTLFRLDASIRGGQSAGRQIADTAEAAWRQTHAHHRTIRRDLAQTPVPGDAWQLSVSAGAVPEEQRTPEQRAAVALAAELATELLESDAYVFAAPLYNYGVAGNLKAWADMIFTDPRFNPGAPSPISGRPAALIITRGGAYGPGTPRAGWDHATGWYKLLFGDMLQLDLHVSEVELTLAEVTPAMAELRGLAKESFAAGTESAGKHGRIMAERIG
ncbi:FMN-dependent NADH-azoreductase [Microtetraspora sp. NBRC 13810]|uniref:FMN-dependent NADH-azoreductase n=1 Tax=Microtetraspora sp. NBRC 13810 TaxID=3030990 RepID=UPI0024A4679B|nr:NAD(P)H-dependent oxidoreductase [Microtetraspora sp. NBRC 13810]GLW07214.1 FMN-dependent NADH-azoreductase [Microtetraspora sp. NBRC 13810]